MAIRFLDEEKPKSRIRFTDEPVVDKSGGVAVDGGEPESNGFLENLSEALKSRVSKADESFSGKSQAGFSRGLQAVGKAAGGLLDVPLTALSTGYGALKEAPIFGGGLKALEALASSGLSKYLELTNKIPGIQSANRAISEKAAAHPEAMKNIEALANIAGIVPVGTVAGATGSAARFMGGKGLQVAGKAIEKAGEIAVAPLTKGGELLEKSGLTTLTSRIKPLKRYEESGFNPENVFKYDLTRKGKDLNSIAKTAGDDISKARAEVVSELEKIMDDPANRTWDAKKSAYIMNAPTIEIKPLFDDARKKFLKNNANADKYAKIIDNYENNVSESFDMGKKTIGELDDYRGTPIVKEKGKLGLLEADDLRQQWGADGSFNVLSQTAETTAQEEVANYLYREMRKAIDESVADSDKLKTLNKKMSDLIPIKGAVEHAIRRLDRNNMLSLDELAAGGVGAVGALGGAAAHGSTGALAGIPLALAYKGLKTAPAAITEYQTGAAIKGLGKKIESGIGKFTIPTGSALQRAGQAINPVLGKKKLFE